MSIQTELKQPMKLKHLFYGIFLFFGIIIFFALIGGDEKENSSAQTSQPQVSQQQTQPEQERQFQSRKTQIPVEPRLLGKWFGKRNVYLIKKDLKYVATFDPPLPKNSLIIPSTSSDPIYPYFVGLLNEVWGLLPSQISNPQFVPPLVLYENYESGEKFPFLLVKDETTGAIFGVSFWKE